MQETGPPTDPFSEVEQDDTLEGDQARGARALARRGTCCTGPSRWGLAEPTAAERGR